MKMIPLLLLLIAATTHAKNCNWKLKINSTNIDWESRGSTFPISFKVTGKKSSSECENFFLTFSKGGARTYQRKIFNKKVRSINYNIYKDSQAKKILRDKRDINSPDQYIYSPMKEAPKGTFYLKLNIPKNKEVNTIQSDVYYDTVRVDLYSGKINGKNTLQSSRSIIVSTYVPKIVDISLVSTGGEFDKKDTYELIDFGELKKGIQRSFDLKVSANSRYKLHLSSLNKSKLKHLIDNEFIDYKMDIDNRRVNLGKDTIVRLPQRHTPGVINTYNVNFTIGDVEKKKAGVYTDYITLTVLSVD